MDSNEIRQAIDRLQREVAALEAAERDGEAGVAALSAQLSEYEGRLTLTQRALADYRRRLVDTSAELEQAITDEARQAFEDAMARREQTAAAVAEAANLFLGRQNDFERLSEEAREAWATWAAHNPNVARDRKAAIDARPEILEEAWALLSAKVRENLDRQLEHDLVEAAARSPLGHAIDDLPRHLQERARQRRRALSRRTPVAAPVEDEG